MENHALYLKYRPRRLDDIIGNSEVVEVLRSQINENKVPHAMLFHGPTGCGKTTLARIVASELGARGADIREIDAADFRGIDTIREIRRQIMFKPMEGSCQVWILDECHRLTQDSQSALLKTLEDTPDHVYFILCTTDPQKLLPAIRGRCADYQVRTLSDDEMLKLLSRVVKAEGERLKRSVYEQIIESSGGHPRNALRILEQVLAVEGKERLEVAKRVAVDQSQVIDLCRALINGERWKKVSKILSGLKNEDPEKIRRAVLGYCQSVLLNSPQGNHQAAAVMEEFESPTYDIGFPGVVLACYRVVFAEE